jgi:cell division septation protein DedD
MARLDLDSQAVSDTFSFYDEMMALPPEGRMATLVTGIIPQSQGSDVAANLELVDSEDRREAAARMTTPPPPEPEPEPEPEIIPILTPQDLTGWSLQIGAYRNIPNMIRGWKILYSRNEDILEGIEPRRSEVSFGERENAGPVGHYFRLNAGPLKTFQHASEVCAELKARGTDCWVRPPEAEEGRLPD